MFALWMACHTAKMLPATSKAPESIWYEISTGLLSMGMRSPAYSEDDPLRTVQAMRMIRSALNSPGGAQKALRDMERADV